MKKNILKIFALLLVLSCLFGCAPAQSPETQPPTEATVPPVEETEPPVEETQPPVALHYDYPELDFSFAFPKEWAGEFLVEQEENSVTVSLGGVPTFSFVSLKNEPGAKEKDKQLEEDGYHYYRENGTHFFYYKFLTDLPEDFCIYQRGDKKPICDVEDAMAECWHIYTETAICSVLEDEWYYRDKWSPPWNEYFYLRMKTPHYINYRVGYMFTLPDYMLSNKDICIRINSGGGGAVGLRNEAYNTADFQAYNDMPFYRLCYFNFASSETSEETREEWKFYYRGQTTSLGNTLYLTINEYTETYHYERYFTWRDYPDHIRNAFSQEQIQEVVDSFQVILSMDEIALALEEHLDETEP